MDRSKYAWMAPDLVIAVSEWMVDPRQGSMNKGYGECIPEM